MGEDPNVSTTTPRPYGGVPAHERVAARRARLLAAALELVGTQGSGAATVRAVCAEAKLTPRYFYESFDDREALMETLLESVATAAAGEVLAAVATAQETAQAKAHAAIGAFVDVLEADPRRGSVLFTEALSEPLTARRVALLRMFATIIAGQARAFYAAEPGEDRVVELTALLLAGGLSDVLMAWLDGALELTRDELVDDVTALFVAAGDAAVAIARARA